ncbi:hypothetical protein LOTGIDRAFT_153481 [Lottia gigantea]|uniref:Uncharacterized protein n=1 Tax=Lottia gigantea TaxID=225164 RepID=V4BY20_LOTGI|nr:hypothetical protein LOTGIDRAFT_153481 [Lottia gigantea]ESO94004.1 hypothetical protein LOTGIDRAFT_153481 [Lottia gigantea]
MPSKNRHFRRSGDMSKSCQVRDPIGIYLSIYLTRYDDYSTELGEVEGSLIQEQRDLGRVPNGILKTHTKDTTQSSLCPESEVSIIISNTSEYDSDSIPFTLPDNQTSTPLLRHKDSPVKNDENVIDTEQPEKTKDQIKEPESKVTDKASEENLGPPKTKAVKTENGENSVAKENKYVGVSKGPKKERNKSKKPENDFKNSASAKTSTKKVEGRKQSKDSNTTKKTTAQPKNNRKMGTNVSAMELQENKDNNRKISRERKYSTDIVQMEYLYRTSQDKAHQRKKSIESQAAPNRVITGVRYPAAQANGDAGKHSNRSSKEPSETLSNGVTRTHSVETSDKEQGDIIIDERGEAVSGTDEEGQGGSRISPEKRVRISSTDPVKDADDFYNRLSMRMDRSGYLREIPSVTLFEKTFKEYLDMGIAIPKDENNIVIPSPPTTKKAELLKSLDFTTIDLHASRVPKKMMDKSLAEMTRFLIKPAGSSRIERVRAIFVWLVTTDLDAVDLESDDSATDDDQDETQYNVEEFLQNIKDDEISHAELFQKMCKVAGIECKTIEGISREYIEQPSNVVTETTTTAWSTVVIQQSWRLVDVAKAAAIYKDSKENLGMALHSESSSESMFGSKKSPINDILDFYFLTDPEQFVFSNLPDEENYQLLPRPVSYAEFTYLPFIKPHYFILGFEEVEKYESITEAKQGKAQYLFRSPESEIRKLACGFYKVEGKSHKHISTKELRDYVYLESDMKTGYFTVRVNVPEAGTYVLEVNGRNGWDTSEKSSGIVSYVIKCARTFHSEPYTENDREEWGPGSDCYIIGLKPVTHPGGDVIIENGEGVVEFEMKTPLDILHTLTHRDISSSELSNFVIHRYEDKILYIHIRVPKEGDYALKIFARNEEEEGVFVNVCTYLVRAIKDVPKDFLPYPKIDDGLVGTNKFFKKLDMENVRPKMCILDCPETGKLKLKINLAPNVHYLPEFKLCRGDEETAMHEYTTWSLVGLMGTFRLNFPQQGIYLFSLYAILPDQGDQVNSVYNSVVFCNWPRERCFPYATSLASWTPYYRLLSPKEVYLVAGTVVKFVVDVPDAIRVSLIGNSAWQHLEKTEDGLWGNDISIEPGLEGNLMKMYASIEDGSKSMFSLLQYKVVSREEMTEMENIQKEYYQSAIQRVQNLKETGEWVDPQIEEEAPAEDELDDGISDIVFDEPVVREVSLEESKKRKDSTNSRSGKDKSKSRSSKKDKERRRKDKDKRNKDKDKQDKDKRGKDKEKEDTDKDKEDRRDKSERRKDKNKRTKNRSKSRSKYDNASSADISASATDAASSSETEIAKSPKSHRRRTKSASSSKSDSSSTNPSKKEETSESETSDVDNDKDYEGSDVSNNSWETRMVEFEELKKKQEDEKKHDQKQIKAMKTQLIMNRLRAATRRKDKLELIRAIDDWKATKNRKTKELIQAERMLDVINLRDDLNTHLKNRNLPKLQKTLEEIEFKCYVSEIPYEVSQARSRIQLADKTTIHYHNRSPTIDVQTLAEIRSYSRPPEVVHQIVVAMLLLIGCPEKNTKKWKKCQKRCVVSGKYGLHSRLHEVDPDEIDPSIAARAQEIIEDHTAAEAYSVSPGVGALFRWVNQIISAVQDGQKDDDSPVKPAHRKKQNMLFREATELSEDSPRETGEYVIREKTQSHFRTKGRGRNPNKSISFADDKKSRSRSRSTRARSKSPEKFKH